MRFQCPKCGAITSSSMSLQAGGYWDKYSQSGPWGCPTCQEKLNIKCSRCGCVGTQGTFAEGKCPACGNQVIMGPSARGAVIALLVIASAGFAVWWFFFRN